MVDKINVSLSILFVVLCTVVPLIILILMWRNFAHLESVESIRKYGELYEKLDLRKGPHVTFVPFIFLMRRFLLAVIVVY